MKTTRVTVDEVGLAINILCQLDPDKCGLQLDDEDKALLYKCRAMMSDGAAYFKVVRW